MAFSFVASASAQGTAVAAPTTTGINTTGADFLVAFVTWNTNSNIGSSMSVSDSKGNTWWGVGSQIVGTGAITSHRYGIGVFCSMPTTVGSGHTFTNNSSCTGGSIAVEAWTAGGPVAVDLVTSGRSVNGATTIQPGSITPRVNGALLLTATGIDDTAGSAMSIDSSFTISETKDVNSGVAFGISMAHLVQGSAAAVRPTWTRSVAVADIGDATLMISAQLRSSLTALSGCVRLGVASMVGSTSYTVDTTGADFAVTVNFTSSSSATASDSKSNTWTDIALVGMGTGSRGSHQVHYSSLASVGTGHTFNVSSAHQYMIAWYKNSLATPFDVENHHSDSGSGHTTLTTNSITPAGNNELLVAVTGIDDPFNAPSSGNPVTIDSGFTLLTLLDVYPGNLYGGAMADLVQGAAAAVNATWTRANANSQVGDSAGIYAFKFSAPVSGGDLSAFVGEPQCGASPIQGGLR